MRSKYKRQWVAIGKLAFVIAFASLYAFGGIEYKWLRRFVAPIVLGLGMWAFSSKWKVLLQIPLLMLTLTMGYGADVIWDKVLHRGIYAIANGATAIVHMNWKLLIWHMVLVIAAVVGFGVFNPFNNARAEELIIGLIIGLLPIYMTERGVK